MGQNEDTKVTVDKQTFITRQTCIIFWLLINCLKQVMQNFYIEKKLNNVTIYKSHCLRFLYFSCDINTGFILDFENYLLFLQLCFVVATLFCSNNIIFFSVQLSRFRLLIPLWLYLIHMLGTRRVSFMLICCSVAFLLRITLKERTFLNSFLDIV